MFEVASIIIVLAALFSFLNFKYLRMPTTIGVTVIALLVSLGLVVTGEIGGHFRRHAAAILQGIDFNELVLHGMLAFLLFAGAFKLHLDDLKREWVPVTLLTMIGTIVSIVFVGVGLFYLLRTLHLPIPLIYCLLFGALISPTDPVAVLSIMKTAGAPKSLETQVAGEALFNDGVAVVAFIAFLALASGQHAPSAPEALLLLIREIGGGALAGLFCGYATYQLLCRIDDHQIEMLLTLALAMGSYAVADALGLSAPISVVVAGLIVGNPGRAFAMSRHSQQRLVEFWELIDNVLNVVLFMLLGLELLVLPISPKFLIAGAAATLIALAARGLSVAGIIGGLTVAGRKFIPGTALLLTWGGLRGGVSLALALSLPPTNHREALLVATYCVVVFSVLVQGLTISPLIRKTLGRSATD